MQEQSIAVGNDVVDILNGDPMTTVKLLVEQGADQERLEGLSDSQLLREAARKVAIRRDLGRPGGRAPTRVPTVPKLPAYRTV